jgi:hypothetical protein
MIALALLPADYIRRLPGKLKENKLKNKFDELFFNFCHNRISRIPTEKILGENRPRSRRRSNVLWTITTPTGSTPEFLLQKDFAYCKCLTAQTISWRHGTDCSTNAVEEVT